MSENNLENNENLEKRYADFISTVSHELRTPLTSIMGFADTLLTSSDMLSDEQKKKFLLIIKEQSKRLISMVENLLVASKIQYSDEKLVYKAVCVNELLIKIVQLMKIQFPNHNLVLDLKKDLPNILIDVDKFQQIIINLVENAAKYSPEKTDITIKTDCNDEDVFVKIIDMGIGISDENKLKIFEKFSRLDTPLTRKTQGSGLGLYIVKKSIEKMEAEIEVLDNKPKGSCFVLTFKQARYQSQSEKKLRG